MHCWSCNQLAWLSLLLCIYTNHRLNKSVSLSEASYLITRIKWMLLYTVNRPRVYCCSRAWQVLVHLSGMLFMSRTSLSAMIVYRKCHVTSGSCLGPRCQNIVYSIPLSLYKSSSWLHYGTVISDTACNCAWSWLQVHSDGRIVRHWL